ncbi:peroxisomal membrane protein PMP34-like [Tropilaelaps mercedesae]|uniref:Peroxisomal membrane protein PMP34-like n=1 Tax=Tropilaelaps mercedesae TaxID=418985 RepID=A0A1V9WY48_9ACAR|nr:peroxisomal membrane protein PMP34-like [Tropilaelaps mercedesae]
MAVSKILMDHLFTYETLVHAVSGAAGATVAMTVFYPLDTIRSRLQVEEGRQSKSTVEMLRDLMDSEGFEGMYCGLSPVLQSLWCSNFVYFYSFHGLRAVLSAGRKHSAGRDLMLASVAGVINVLLTTPMWVVNTRMKMQGAKSQHEAHQQALPAYKYKNIVDGLVTLYREEGASALWSSALPSIILVSNPSIQFMVYEALKRRCEALGITLSAGTAFSIGAISKCIATVLTYPLQLVQSKMRYNNDKRSMFAVMVYIVRNFGAAGLFKGLESKLLQTVLTAALMFMAYEKISSLVFKLMRLDKTKG